MGQKTHPVGFRVGITKDWRSRWFTRKKAVFGKLLVADQLIRKAINKKFAYAGISHIEIERKSPDSPAKVTVFAARPGVIIGKKGVNIESLRKDLLAVVGSAVDVDAVEISNPDANAQLLSVAVSEQLARRVSFRRAMKKTIEQAMNAGAEGVKIMCSGRLGGAEMSRCEHYTVGRLPLSTLDADIDYGFTEAATAYGNIGVKVWVNLGVVKPYKKLAREK